MKLNCIIVDDEDLAREVIETYLKDIDFLNLVASCSNAMEALNCLNSNQIDLIFLDINMPKMDGLSFLKTLNHPPKVIITTAYREYAVEGFELDVVDYLSKPFSMERFLIAVNKTVKRINSEKIQPTKATPSQTTESVDTRLHDNFIFIKTDKVTHRVDLNDILYVEAVGDYVKIITTKKSLITYMYLKDVETLLPSKQFPRVHRSFIVSVSRIDTLEGNRIFIGDSEIPIGKHYKENLQNIISS